MNFDIFRPNAPISSQSLNNTQMTNSCYNLFHWCLHKVQEYEKRKNMTGALARNGKINGKLNETDMLRVILT